MQQMLTKLRRRREDERGFTLIELMVVVLIIAILIAIAIPTFLGAKSRAQDKAAQSSLRNALTNAKGVYTDQDSFGATSAALVTGLTAAEPSLTFQTTASTGAKVVSVNVISQYQLAMAAKSSSGTCYVIGDDAQGPGTVFKNLGTASCDASTVTSVPAVGSPPTITNAAAGGGWAQAW